VVVGNGLLGASVGSPDPALRVSNLRSAATEVRFTLTVDESASLGPHGFTLSSSLGSAGFTLTVKPAAPLLVANPSPVVLAPNGDSAEILLTLGNADDIDHHVELAVTDPTLAAVSASALDLPAGETEARVVVTSGVLGSTVLDLPSAALDRVRVGIFVTEEGPGERFRVARPAGVLRQVPGVIMGPLLVAPNVGVVRATAPAVSPSGPFVAPPVGVVRAPPPTVTPSGPFVAPSVGVVRATAPTVTPSGPFVAPAVGVLKEP